ncbi:MAG TPA: DUF92 domain-containing protein [Thermomicrobiales bacterium]|nr:DUF92 domain-containing protein [Thermomicrobiales bacterium]
MRARLLAGSIVSAAISLAGWRAKALSGRGALTATGVGASIATGSSWPGMVVLGTFFISSSALSRLGSQPEIVAKGSQRDERQVLANGAVAAIAALVGGKVDRALGTSLAAGALAAATADTWATELGAGSQRIPRLAWSGRSVPPGTSGGVTPRGSLASLGGAIAIGIVTVAVVGVADGRSRALRIGPGVVVAGLAGSLADSLLGELVQERRRCPACDVLTEARVHHCGTATVHAGGVRGVDNDVINLACTAVGLLAMIPFGVQSASSDCS